MTLSPRFARFSSAVCLLGCLPLAYGRPHLTNPGGQTPATPNGKALVAGDFNKDGCDDVLLIGRDTIGSCGIYFGSRKPPYFTAGPKMIYPSWWDISDAPLYVGGYLYIPILVRYTSSATIEILRFWNGRLSFFGAIGIYLTNRNNAMTTLKITAIDKDIDGDKKPDTLAVWNESPLLPNGSYHAAYMTPKGKFNEVAIPPLKNQIPASEIVDVHVSKSFMSASLGEEYILVLSAFYMNGTGGYGVTTLGKNLAPGPGIYAVGPPPLMMGGWAHNQSSSCYGKFSNAPSLGSPLLQLTSGEALIYDPWVTAPYLRNTGHILYSHRSGFFLDTCTTDYDGDGIAEVVLVENHWPGRSVLLYIGDPTSTRPYAQAYNLADPSQPTSLMPIVQHGTKGDFNGDGLQDLLLAYSNPQGHFALFLADRCKGPGKPALRRVY